MWEKTNNKNSLFQSMTDPGNRGLQMLPTVYPNWGQMIHLTTLAHKIMIGSWPLFAIWILSMFCSQGMWRTWGKTEAKMRNTFPSLMDPRTKSILYRYHKIRETSGSWRIGVFHQYLDMILFFSMCSVFERKKVAQMESLVLSPMSVNRFNI